MVEPATILAFYEGDDDRAVLQGLHALKLLPPGLEIADRIDKSLGGRNGLVANLFSFVSPINGAGKPAVALLDLDDRTPDQLFDWFQKALVSRVPPSDRSLLTVVADPQSRSLRLTAGALEGRVALVPVGLPGDPLIADTYALDQSAIDDYILRAVHRREVYEAVRDFAKVDFELSIRKIGEVAALFRANGIEIHQAKRLIYILRAVNVVRPSTATIYEGVMKATGKVLSSDDQREQFAPLIDDIARAVAAIRS